ncbi:MAG: ATP-binding cassette domain-containing protein [Defluviitaleaceae bacterium]|nr:ATP-binding cassette domain-containing protein [Defluviitaleaceae bacterium]
MNNEKSMKASIILDWLKSYHTAIVAASLSKAAPIVLGILSAGVLGNFLNNLLLMDTSAISTDIFLIIAIFASNVVLIPVFNLFNYIYSYKVSNRYHEKKVSKSLDKDYIKSNAMGAGAKVARWEVNLLLFYTEMLKVFSSVATVMVSLFFIIPVLLINTTLGIISILLCIPISLFDILSSKKQVLFYSESLEYNEIRKSDELNMAQGHGFIKNNNIINQFLSAVNKRFTDYFTETKYKNIKLKTLLDTGSSFLTYISILVLFAAGGYMFLQGNATPGEVLMYVGLLLPISGIIKLCSELFVSFKKMPVILEKVLYFFCDFENVSGNHIESVNNIKAEDLNFSYNDTGLIQGVNIDIKRDSKLQIVGKNGSGKTTLANIISGIISDADIYVNDMHYKTCDINAIRDKICYVDQDSYFFSGTINDNLSIVTKGTQDDYDRIDYYLNLFSLDKEVSHELLPGAANLSGGEKQKLSIIRGLLKNADVYIFDEPLNNLDQETREVFCEEINRLKAAYIIISHDKVNLQFDHTIQMKEHPKTV